MAVPTNIKKSILANAELVKHANVFFPDMGKYVSGFLSKPCGLQQYQGDRVEPLVDTDDLGLLTNGEAWLSVNQYNAVVLNSTNLFIADIDFGDPRLDRFATALEEDDVIESLSQLSELDETTGKKWEATFAAESYRVYRTCRGCRVICTSRCFPWDRDGYEATRLMRFLRSDPEYLRLCEVQRCYRARLTPKPWRLNGVNYVCKVIHQVGAERVHPRLQEQLDIHDQMTAWDGEEESVLA